jgi:hypothetical protein
LPAVVIAAYHVVCFGDVCCGQVEYRIGCHSAQSLRPAGRVDYPDLAVRMTFTGYANTLNKQ